MLPLTIVLSNLVSLMNTGTRDTVERTGCTVVNYIVVPKNECLELLASVFEYVLCSVAVTCMKWHFSPPFLSKNKPGNVSTKNGSIFLDRSERSHT